MNVNEAVNKEYPTVRKLVPYLALAVLLALSFGLWRHFEKLSAERERRRFNELVAEKIKDITERLDKYNMVLQGGVGLFIASEQVNRAEWRAYVDYRQFNTHFPGAQGIGFSQVIQPTELAQHIRSIRAEGFPDYTVWPDGKRDVYTAIIFLEPFDARNQRAFGYDMFSERVRRAAMTRARDTGEASMSGRVTLVQETDQAIQHGFLIYLPVYAKCMSLNSAEERREAIQGYVYAPFRMNDFIMGVFPEINRKIDLHLYDGTVISPENRMYDSCVESGRTDPHESRKAMFAATSVLDLYGHQWTLKFKSTPLFDVEAHPFITKLILIGAIFASMLIFIMLKMLETLGGRAFSLARKMTDELRESEARHQLLNDVLPLGVSLIGPSMEILAANVVQRRWFPYRGSAQCPPCYEVFNIPPRTEPCPGCPVVLTFQDGQPHAGERAAATSMGRRTLSISTTPLFGPDGKVAQVHEVVEDITGLKQAEADRIARQAAEVASREKSQFLANMSHEIRTPMNAILGFAQIIERDPALDPANAARIRSINRAGQHLLALLNDILDMAKIEAGMTVHKPRAFSLHDLLDDLLSMFRSRADAKGLQLIMERDAGVPFMVLADEAKLRQVLVNLIGNAVKFTQQGGVAVRVRADPAAETGRPASDSSVAVRLIVEVEDSGPGIPAADLERIFGAFAQSEAGREAGGTGLGLSISRNLAEMMGGTLTVQSEVGRGSCFRFDVLLEATAALPEKMKSEARRRVIGLAPGTGPRRVLVVDDMQGNCDLLRDLLQPVGFEVREARDGEEALVAFAEWSPHAVLMDMRMPVMDGYEATRRIKATEAGRSTPVIAVTASAFKESEEEILRTGVSAYLRKPFRIEEIFEVLGQCLDLRYVYAGEPDKTPARFKASGLTPESVAALPAELRRAMREAVAKGDMSKLAELFGQIRTNNPDVAAGLHALVERYDYGRLNELLANGENDDD